MTGMGRASSGGAVILAGVVFAISVGFAVWRGDERFLYGRHTASQMHHEEHHAPEVDPVHADAAPLNPLLIAVGFGGSIAAIGVAGALLLLSRSRGGEGEADDR